MSSIPDQRTRPWPSSPALHRASAQPPPALATKGLRVVLLACRAERIDDLARGPGESATVIQADVTDQAALARLEPGSDRHNPLDRAANHARALDDPAIGTIAAAHGKTRGPSNAALGPSTGMSVIPNATSRQGAKALARQSARTPT